ncbi:hypothetical protein BGZ65_004541 [Modicella reniformis]|uniref:Uncharacterized protein n=1 Tax=Modicella reniformis TaxID=1440133 RepID=A0A9P6J1L8_9FUNG|nr:hypothetical protein BGZ65_004541 [Modicella reniformis]
MDVLQVPKEVRERATSLLSTTNVELFRQKYKEWLVETEKHQAKQSLAEGSASLAKGTGSILKDGESSHQAASRMPLAPSSSTSTSSSSSNLKKRKRPATEGGLTSTTTSTEPDLNSRKERFAAMDKSQFWKLKSGRTVEEVLYNASLKREADFKMRSYTIDFACERTKTLFTNDEWEEMKELDVLFKLPRLPETTEKYLRDVRKALVKGKHVASVPIPKEDQNSCELVLDSFLSWKQLYTAKPCPFGNKDLSESFWCREAWPIMKRLLSDVDGLTMIDGEITGLESEKRRNMGRKVDMETPPSSKQSGRRLDLVARDTTNKRDWFVVESLEEWDEVSTTFLRELDVTLFRELHLIASHRLQEQPSSHFHNQACFFAVYSGGRGFKTMEMKACPFSDYIMLVHLYDSYLLPTTAARWRPQVQGLTHLLQVRDCVSRTVKMYQDDDEDEENDSDDEWLYS